MLSPWVNDVLGELSQRLGMIADIWNAMGLEGENLRLRIHSLSSHLFLMLDEMYSEEIIAKQSIIDSIKELKVKIRELESELGLTNNIPETSSLVMTEKLFYDHFKALTEKSSSIIQTYNLLKEEEKDLCARLDEPSVPETFIHVPNAEQIRILKENIDHLTLEKRSRSLRLSRLIQEIKNLRDLLQQKTIDDEEIITLITAPNPLEDLSLSKNFLDHVTKLRNSLAQEFVKLDGDCQRIIKEIMHIAGRLNIDNGVNIQQPVSARFLQHLKEELNRLKKLQLRSLASIISKCQAELVVWWENCFVGRDVRQSYLISEGQELNESLLISLESEITKWKSFYLENEPLFKAIETWQCILSRLRMSEQKMKDPSVLKNRCGILLVIDKEIKQLKRDLSRQYSILKEISMNYPNVTVHGLSILDYLDFSEHQCRIEKENQNPGNLSSSFIKVGNSAKRAFDANKSTLLTPISGKKPRTDLLNSTIAAFSSNSKLNAVQSPLLACSSMVSLHGIGSTDSLSSVHMPITKAKSSVQTPVTSCVSSSSSSRKKIASTISTKRRSARLSGKKVCSTLRVLQVKNIQNNSDNPFLSPLSTAPRSAVKSSRIVNNTPTPSVENRIHRAPFRT
ncbi:carboxypeptidase C prc1 [Schistosoma haematobium]|uniref:Carboxypeptidase C prc1 n=1 Tax=Schistosoma haematobium TaxID=6185 RepID=A0A922S0G8_SCHHA|nr:carboxypeptidase C prc1 [Schistosoma haematobium]KAH9588156.1 carboxypeptidase C prc1 [Schistosoma haematobium]CAH8560023.1 unnamed protein product [Schistosoma haematobium]